jgi:arylsulfatase A-like enzyme/lipopolysaccharide biosynthesis regulator YciM
MSNHKRKNNKKKKNNAPVIKQNPSYTVPPSPPNTTATGPGIKKWLPTAAVIAGILLIAYFIFAPKLKKSLQNKQLKSLNVILFTLDTLRSDYVSAYRTQKAETPNIDKIAEEGVLFETCIAQTPLTLPSHTSILSGTYPLYHQVRDNGGFLVPRSLRLISEMLKEKDFSTSAFIASYVLHSKWGINQGFDTYNDDFDLTKFKSFSLGNIQKRADEVLGSARAWLTDHKKNHNDKRFFTWIHLYDPHTPYDPPSPFKEKCAGKPYRGEIEYMDHQLGLFFQYLKDEGLYDNSLIIMIGDHGESLGQHGEKTHGFYIYEPAVRVPFIIRAPFRFPVQRVTALTETVDVVPTILDALEIPVPAEVQGQSLLKLMRGTESGSRRTAYTETYYPRFHFGWSELKALYYDGKWKYIQAPKKELYDIHADKLENNNLALKKSYQANKAGERLQRFVKEKSIGAKTPGDTKNLNKQDVRKLAALGYLTSSIDTAGKTNLPDPKGKVHIFNDLSRAREFLGANRADDAIRLLENVVKEEPHLVDGILQLGNAYFYKRRYQEALKSFYQVLEKKPDYNAAMINVLNTLVNMGEFDRGIKEAQRFLKTFPNDHSLLNEMGTIYFMKEEYDRAIEILEKSLQIEKTNPGAINTIAGIHIVKKEYDNARSLLEKAEKINPNLRKLHYHMAQVEEGQGNIEKAIQHYKKELENFPNDYKSAYNLAEDFRKTNRPDDALKYYRKAIDCNPKFNIPYFMIAKYYLDRKENLNEAVKLCTEGIALKPENKYTAFGYYILADISSYRGDQSTARTYLAKAQQLKDELIKQNRW